MNIIKFIAFMAIGQILGWYLVEGLLWVEFKVKPYTETGMIVLTVVQHAVFCLLISIISWRLADD